MEKQKRIRMKSSNKRWTKEDTLVFLNKLLENKNFFEKPSAQVFYKKIINEEASLSDYSWVEMRDRMRNLKMKYKNAVAWRANTDTILLDEDNEKEVEEYLLKLCPFYKELDEIYQGKANFVPPFSFGSTDSVTVLEVDMGRAVVIAHGEEEHGLSQSNWLAASTNPGETTERMEDPPLDNVNYYKEQYLKNRNDKSLKTSLDCLVPVYPLERSQQKSEPEVECRSARKHLEGTQSPKLTNVPRIDISENTEETKPNQPQPSISKNKKKFHDLEISCISSAIDKLLEVSNSASQVNVNKDDSFDHFGRYIASMLRGLGQPKAVRLQQNITNMIAKAMCPPSECPSKKKAGVVAQLMTVAEKLVNSSDTKPMDSWEAFGLSVGGDLRNMEEKQQIMAQKLISDVIFLAKTSRFNEESGINVSSLFHIE